MDDLVQRLRDAINEKYPIRGHATGELLRDALAALSAPAHVPPQQGEYGEPWIENAPGDVWHGMGPGGHVAQASPDNARRIVSCVNACAGMADPAAEIAKAFRPTT